MWYQLYAAKLQYEMKIIYTFKKTQIQCWILTFEN